MGTHMTFAVFLYPIGEIVNIFVGVFMIFAPAEPILKDPKTICNCPDI